MSASVNYPAHVAATAASWGTETAIACARLDDALHLLHLVAWGLRGVPHIQADLAQRLHSLCAETAAVRDDACQMIPGAPPTSPVVRTHPTT